MVPGPGVTGGGVRDILGGAGYTYPPPRKDILFCYQGSGRNLAPRVLFSSKRVSDRLHTRGGSYKSNCRLQRVQIRVTNGFETSRWRCPQNHLKRFFSVFQCFFPKRISSVTWLTSCGMVDASSQESLIRNNQKQECHSSQDAYWPIHTTVFR